MTISVFQLRTYRFKRVALGACKWWWCPVVKQGGVVVCSANPHTKIAHSRDI